MILVGNQRGNSADLAAHLMSADNERVQVHETRGFVSDTLEGAFNESYAISKGTRCRQHLFSLSLNPPADVEVSEQDFEAAIARAEKKLGLKDQPRAIVFHEKQGADGQVRRHCHAVWSRIDADTMKAVHLPFTKRKLQEVSRDLYVHHGWNMPPGLIDRSERDPLNFTHKQWQQAKRIGKDPKAIKRAFVDAWAFSDNKTAFSHALAERGYHIAKGDRRGFVAVDAVTDEIFAIPKWADVKTKAVRERLGDESHLPSIAEVRSHIARQMLPKMREFKAGLSVKFEHQSARFESYKEAQTRKQDDERKAQALEQKNQKRMEALRQQSRFRKGFRGLLDRLTGKYARTRKENLQQAETLKQQQRSETTALQTRQDMERERLQTIRTAVERKTKTQSDELARDTARFAAYRLKREKPPPAPDIKKTFSSSAPDNDRKPDREAYRAKRKQTLSPVRQKPRAPDIGR